MTTKKITNQQYPTTNPKYDIELDSNLITINVENCVYGIIEENLDEGFDKIKYEISNNLPYCMSNLDIKNYEGSYSQPKTELFLSDDLNTIHVNVHFPIEMSNDKSIKTIENFYVKYPLKKEFELPEDGVLLKDSIITSSDGKVKLLLKKHTLILDNDNNIIKNIGIKSLDTTDYVYQNTVGKLAYIITPNNIKFSKNATLSINYNEPFGDNFPIAKNINLLSFSTDEEPIITFANESDLAIVELLTPNEIIPNLFELEHIKNSTIDKNNNEIIIQINKSGIFGVAPKHSTIMSNEKVLYTTLITQKNNLDIENLTTIITKAYLPSDGELPIYGFSVDGFNIYTTNELEKEMLIENPHLKYDGVIAKLFNNQKPGTVPFYRLTHFSGYNYYTTDSVEIQNSKKYSFSLFKEILKEYNQESNAEMILNELDFNGDIFSKLSGLTNNEINDMDSLLVSISKINLSKLEINSYMYEGLQGYVYENPNINSKPLFQIHVKKQMMFIESENYFYISGDSIIDSTTNEGMGLITGLEILTPVIEGYEEFHENFPKTALAVDATLLGGSVALGYGPGLAAVTLGGKVAGWVYDKMKDTPLEIVGKYTFGLISETGKMVEKVTMNTLKSVAKYVDKAIDYVKDTFASFFSDKTQEDAIALNDKLHITKEDRINDALAAFDKFTPEEMCPEGYEYEPGDGTGYDVPDGDGGDGTSDSDVGGGGIADGGASGESGPGSGNTCFVKGTKILLANNSWKKIEDIKIGDQVKGKNDIINNVMGYDRPIIGTRKTYILNHKIEFTGDHPFLGKDGIWRVANLELFNQISNPTRKTLNPIQMKVGDNLLTNKGYEIIEIIELNYDRPESEIVYDLRLDGDSTYTANNFIVHNCW